MEPSVDIVCHVQTVDSCNCMVSPAINSLETNCSDENGNVDCDVDYLLLQKENKLLFTSFISMLSRCSNLYLSNNYSFTFSLSHWFLNIVFIEHRLTLSSHVVPLSLLIDCIVKILIGICCIFWYFFWRAALQQSSPIFSQNTYHHHCGRWPLLPQPKWYKQLPKGILLFLLPPIHRCASALSRMHM